MKNISIGKIRGFQQCTSARGTFTCLALDHRQNLRKANPIFESNNELSRFKLDVTNELAGSATAVLLDPEVSAAQAIATGDLPGHKGLVVALEATGYEGHTTARNTRLISGWNVEKAKRMGASMVKLLVYYHPEAVLAKQIYDLVVKVADECSKFDIGLMLEPLTYPLVDSKLSGEEKRDLVVETARTLTSIPGVDVLKAELPYDPQEKDPAKIASACSALSQISSVPWILLSGAVQFDIYLWQAGIACQSGASGTAVGRAVWQDVIQSMVDERRSFLRRTAVDRMEKLAAVCDLSARPWTDFYSCKVEPDWYKSY